MTRDDVMLAAMRRHMDAEVARDLEGAIETLVKDPYYEFHPVGLRIRGQTAVRELYKRLLPENFDIIESSATTFKTDDPKNLWMGSDSIVVREFIALRVPNGERVDISQMVILTFDRELLVGEQFYCNGPAAKLYEQALGSDFQRLPGVERIY